MQPDSHDNIRVSDAEREQVVTLLGQAAGEGRLTIEEYTDRVDQAYAAKTRAELAPLLQDLPVSTRASTSMPAFRKDADIQRLASQPDASERLLAIFSSDLRDGEWLVPAVVRARAVFGECVLHFQDAHLQHHVTEVRATAVFGSVVLVVPEGIDVRLDGLAVFGSKEKRARSRPGPDAPILNVHCHAVFGSVEVRLPKAS